MRKFRIVLIGVFLVLIFSSCANSTNTSNETNKSSSLLVSESVIFDSKNPNISESQFNNLEEFLQSPKMQLEIVKIKTAIENDSRFVELTGENDSEIVLTIKSKEFMENTDSNNEVIKNVVDSNSKVFEEFLKELISESKMDNINLSVKYCNIDDSVIYQKNFKNETLSNVESKEIKKLKVFLEQENGKEYFYEKMKNAWVSTKVYLKSDNKVVIEQVYNSYTSISAEEYYSKYMKKTEYSAKIRLASIIMDARLKYNLEEFSIVYIINNSDGSKLYELEAFESDAG